MGFNSGFKGLIFYLFLQGTRTYTNNCGDEGTTENCMSHSVGAFLVRDCRKMCAGRTKFCVINHRFVEIVYSKQSF